MQTIQETIKQLHSALSNYIEATYHISAKSLIKQRKRLLTQPGVIHQIPYLESTPRYPKGEQFSEMNGLPTAALEVFHTLSRTDGDMKRIIYDPPFFHQSEAVRVSLIEGGNLIIMTGTGSGKTEAFLLPILGKLAHQAKEQSDTFANQAAMRALIMYPMNALVNDQLGRLRDIFGDARLVSLFKEWADRPPRFARYTSRTPYAGIRTREKDYSKYKAFSDFYVETERLARDSNADEQTKALSLMKALKDRGKWPAKPDLTAWLGEKGSRWSDTQTGKFRRAVTLPDDSELLTRHEVQTNPPDILVTNYSMLEYMLMRPIERKIFDETRQFFKKNKHEKFLVVLDEAHLYRGAAGAEVGLLLRRLRDRLGLPKARFQVICSTASFNDHVYAKQFAGQLTGLPPSSFSAITGSIEFRPNSSTGSVKDAKLLAKIDLGEFYLATSDRKRYAILKPLLDYRKVTPEREYEIALFHALKEFDPMGLLINETMKNAVAISELGHQIFPTAPLETANKAVTVLMALGSVARLNPKTPGLLPCRIHNFFRGLVGLWVCLDPECSSISNEEKEGICGKMYSQPRDTCECGARVLELFTCRNCGTAYARAYTDNVDSPTAIWADPGQIIRTADGQTVPALPLDLLLETPQDEDSVEPMTLDLETGRLNPRTLGYRNRQVYVTNYRLSDSVDESDEQLLKFEMRGQFKPCAVCLKSASFGRSYVQDHQTKGDEPFHALVARQLQIQPPYRTESTQFAPLQGRKVLTFSDSRQVAARLAPNLQTYSVRDSLRPLIVFGFKKLESFDALRPNLSLDDLYLAVLVASAILSVRLCPELKSHESFDAAATVANAIENGVFNDIDDLQTLRLDLRGERPPEILLESIVTTILHRFFGFEALALASITEKSTHTHELESLPPLSAFIETPDAKIALARTWLRCWRDTGFWLNSMRPEWWKRPRTDGISVRGHTGRFKAIDSLLFDREMRRTFRSEWLPKLLALFTETSDGGHKRLRGSELTLSFEGKWHHCLTCKSVHRPVPGIEQCLDCGNLQVRVIDPNSDLVFLARKGFYRNPVLEALGTTPHKPLALVAAEHTAQLNAPQIEDVFSMAEENELLFQDIEFSQFYGERMQRNRAIDVLSSTTTMEVGIDIGALSGVALRNMPPGRANYQQRSGRAGRRGNGVATVLAFGSADSHDEHYFTKPDEMIRGDVIDPRLTLDNREIICRHVRAFLLQSYHQARLPNVNPKLRHDLFSVLGTVSEFRSNTSILNREDFEVWLMENQVELQHRVSDWIPEELTLTDRERLLDEMVNDCLDAIDDAIRPTSETIDDEIEGEENTEIKAEVGVEHPHLATNNGKLLDRLLYCGKLPRYAFPTDVATFHVFDRDRSTSFRPVLRFAPQQDLPVALTQYAPSKQVWIAGKCYVSGAVYSAYPAERWKAWSNRQIYRECRACGFAKTYLLADVSRNDRFDCEACGHSETFGPGRIWIRPPGFAHPIDVSEVTSPDDVPDTSYATRAKLTMGTPGEDAGWTVVNQCIRVLRSREHLLVSNTGPRKDGYTYCLNCGRIEASTNPNRNLTTSHKKPFPTDDADQICKDSNLARNIVLGTDFITDIALFSLKVTSPLRLHPHHTTTVVALRTVSEALATAACRLLEIEPGEIMAEFRPALTEPGKTGLEAEIFLYDTLPGGAGFSSQLTDKGLALFELALEILEGCPEECETSCYRCVRSFKNKFEHQNLDRHVGKLLLNYLISGLHQEFDVTRLQSSTALLYQDLLRQSPDGMKFTKDKAVSVSGESHRVPIFAEIEANNQNFIITLSGPLTPNFPADSTLRRFHSNEATSIPLIIVDELKVRSNLPNASQYVLQKLREGNI